MERVEKITGDKERTKKKRGKGARSLPNDPLEEESRPRRNGLTFPFFPPERFIPRPPIPHLATMKILDRG